MRRRLAASFLALLAFNIVFAPAALTEPPRGRPRVHRYQQILRSRGATERDIEEVGRRLNQTWVRKPKLSDLKPIPSLSAAPEKLVSLSPSGIGTSEHRRSKAYITWVQRCLNSVIDAGLTVDGRNGPATTGKVRQFQKEHKLRVDGNVGVATERLLTELAGSQPPLGFSEGSALAGIDLSNLSIPSSRTWNEADALAGRLSNLLGTAPAREIDPVLLDDALYVDVRTKGSSTHALVWLGALRNAPPERLDPAWADVTQLNSPDKLKELLSTRRTLVTVGDSLPMEWADSINRDDVLHVHVSERSPKNTLDEHVRAAAILARRYEPGKTKIFSGLPKADREPELIDELESLGLRRDQAEGWRRLGEEIKGIEKETGNPVEEATKTAVLEALRSGNMDTIVLFAHSQYGSIRLLDGNRITREELQSVRRGERPLRTVVLISCDTGNVNANTPAIAEILLENNLASNVIAPPGLVSATEIPAMMRRFLRDGQTLNSAFNGGRRYLAISKLFDDGEGKNGAATGE